MNGQIVSKTWISSLIPTVRASWLGTRSRDTYPSPLVLRLKMTLIRFLSYLKSKFKHLWVIFDGLLLSFEFYFRTLPNWTKNFFQCCRTFSLFYNEATFTFLKKMADSPFDSLRSRTLAKRPSWTGLWKTIRKIKS